MGLRGCRSKAEQELVVLVRLSPDLVERGGARRGGSANDPPRFQAPAPARSARKARMPAARSRP
jgi:hypothetical protein